MQAMTAADAPPATFEEYAAARGAALLRFATLLTGDRHRAEDLVQDALAKTYLRWERIRRSDQPDVYVRRILANASRSWWRRRSSHELPTNSHPDGPGPRDPADGVAERDIMRRLIARLPQRQRVVLVLRYYEDLDDATIAAIMGCRQVTVRTHAMRGLQTLRDRYPTADGRNLP